MKKILIISFFILFAVVLKAQTYYKYWDKTFGGNAEEREGKLLYSGNKLIITGHSATNINGDKTLPLCDSVPQTDKDIWMLITDTALNIISQHAYGGKQTEIYVSADLIPFSDNMLVCCHTPSDSSCQKSEDSRGLEDYWMCFLDSAGNKKWDRTLGGSSTESFSEIIRLTTGDILISGKSASPVSGDKTDSPYSIGYDFWAVKLDSSGNKIWDKVYGSSGPEQLNASVSLQGGRFMLGGQTLGPADYDITDTSRGLDDVWLILLDSAGNKIWDQRYGGSGSDICDHIREIPGGYIICGRTSSPQGGEVSDLPRGSSDYWILKLDSLGNKIWDKRFGGSVQDYAKWIEPSSDGGYWVAGYISSDTSIDISEPSYGFPFQDYWILKLDSLGNKIWDKRFGGPGADLLSNFVILPDGSIILFGSAETGTSAVKTDTGKGDSDYWLVRFKYDESGVGLSENGNGENEFAVYPNPAENTITVIVNADFEIPVLILHDLSGREVLRKEFSRQITIPVNNLSPGMYIFTVTGSSGKTEKGKLVKQ